MKHKITVIHHSADFDGLFCREIARKFLPDATLIGWDWGQPLIPFPDGMVYVMDLSPDCFDQPTMPNPDVQKERLIWIDHHKSAIDKWASSIPGYRIDGVAACRLAWQFLSTACKMQNGELPGIEGLPDLFDYKDRRVVEPYAVQLAGEHDIWDKRNPDAEVLQLGLRSRELKEHDWSRLLSSKIDPILDGTGMEVTCSHLICFELLEAGRILQRYQRQQDTFVMKSSFIVEFEGLKFLALNTQAKSSLAFASKDVQETGHEALMKFSFNGELWDFSLYHAKHNTGIDLSKIAVKYGGGGHRGACGFRSQKLPFLP